MDAFLLKDQGRQRTLADLIVEKIKENDAAVASGKYHARLLINLCFNF